MINKQENKCSLQDEHQTSGYMPIKARDLDPKYSYCIINAVGNCMNSDISPIKIKNGDKLLIHEIDIAENEIMKNMGKVICYMLNNGQFYFQHLVFSYCNNYIVVESYNPQEEKVIVHLRNITRLFVVDEALNPEYVKKKSIAI